MFCFFSPEFRCVSNDYPCLKTIGLYDDFFLSSLFHFFCFIFCAPISFSLCFPVSVSCLLFFLKPLSSIVRKLLYIHRYVYVYINIVYIIKICILET